VNVGKLFSFAATSLQEMGKLCNSPGTSFERHKRVDFSQVWCEKFPQKRKEHVRILREFFPPKSTKYARFPPAAGELRNFSHFYTYSFNSMRSLEASRN
jgi:hypothetical protein